MLQPPAAIIATLKCPSAPKAVISRPYLALAGIMLAGLDIRLQVEDIDHGLLLFWQEAKDFDRTVAILQSLGTIISPSTWEKGGVEWRLTLLKPSEQDELKRVLEDCHRFIIGLFGATSTPTITGITISFQVPVVLKFFDVLQRLLRE